MPPEVWAVIGSAITGVLIFLGARVTSRQSTKATEIASTPDGVRADTERIEALWKRLDAADAENRAMRAELAQIKAERAAEEQRIRTHEVWDTSVLDQARRARLPISDPPPLRSHP